MLNNSNQISKDAWNANVEIWDKCMGNNGNDFFDILCWSEDRAVTVKQEQNWVMHGGDAVPFNAMLENGAPGLDIQSST